MDLKKMLTAQAELDKYIVEKKGLQGVDLVPNTFLAVQVELAEFANEGRWFKHWSDDQEPRTKVPVTAWGEPYKNPLLEEYVDCVHFFLSIANQKGWQDALYIYEEAVEDLREDGFDGGLTGIFLEMTYFINKSYFENPSEEKSQQWKEKFGFPQKQYWFRTAWILFLNIGINGFGFTLDQIEEAYWAKNKINYVRQQEGY
ncbi:dUTP diphosphatase [Heyndrickxia sporothermodurans]|uniref:dUTP diphosphatase n=1 Tax=Heyndrickxia sporothermodurans TaxID=46224 RepID=UPI002DB634B5|nr:dUTP diphosphatase [Heyndrickxia sporothermodurans]MEB6549110.1 dUTP diphosphatase [Heyndrickxia sporothermodurans]